jgi:hypothetical protein
MSVASLDAENVAWQEEGSNLTTAISEKLKRADCAGDNLVYIIRRFSLSENFGTSLVLELAPKGILSK